MNKISNRMVMNQILSTGFGTKVQDKMWNEFCTDDKMKKAAEARKFRPHPKRVDSDSEASSLNSSPQSESNLELDFYCDKQVRLDVNQKMVNNRKIIAERIAELTNSVKRGVKSQEVKEFTRVHEVKVILDKCQNNIQPEMKKDEVDEAPEKIKEAVQNNEKTTAKEVVPQNCQKTTKEVVPQNNQKTAKEVAAKRSGCYLDVDQKLKSIFEKTFNVIDDISFQLDRGIDLPDGNEDYVRRKTRSAEFSTRFSRNYLYQLGREIEGLQRLIMAGNCACTCTTQKKLHSAHQIILQGLQNYHSHIQTTMPNLTTGKVKELIEKSKSLCEVHGQSLSGSRTQIHVKRLELISTFSEKLTALLEKIQGYAVNSSITLLKCNNGTRVSLISHNTSKPKINVRSKKNNLKSRFAMYSDSAFLTNELAWRQATANLAKKKSKVQSRYKTATFKHRPPVEKPHIVTMPPRNKLFGKCASSFIQHTPIQSPIKEENIVTMVGGMEQEEDTDNASEISEKKRLEPILKAFVQKISSGEDVTQDKLETIMSDILRVVRYQNGRTVENGAGNADIAAKMFEYVMKCSMKTDEGQNEVGKKNSDANGLQNKISVSEFGPKNARLICIKDDRSIAESPVPKDEEESGQKLKPEVKVIGVSSETQTDVSVSPEEIEKRKQQMSIKISRLPKRELQLPPKDFMIEIIRYKLDLSKYSKGNAMYRKSASVKPWQLLARVSDKILDDLLLSVAREIELNDILEKLYESEFH